MRATRRWRSSSGRRSSDPCGRPGCATSEMTPVRPLRPPAPCAWCETCWLLLRTQWLDRSSRPLRGVGKRVVEGIEGALRRDRDLEPIAGAGVLDRHGQVVLLRMPEQPHVDAVAVASGELASLRCGGAHGSSFSFAGDERALVHGMWTSVTLVAVVRSA